MIKVADVDFEFIYSQNDIEDNLKKLRNLLGSDELKEIDSLSKKIEKKYDLFIPINKKVGTIKKLIENALVELIDNDYEIREKTSRSN